MKFSKLTVLLLSFLFVMSTSCSKDFFEDNRDGSNVMNGAQETPAVTTSATGNMTYSYNPNNRILSYTFTWAGLSGNPTGMHIHGAADPGFAAGVLQGISGFAAATSGKFTGTAYMDEVVLKETDLLNGKLYINIHTAANPNGEIRGQIVFQ